MTVAAAVVTAIIIGALYFGREVFVPIALAIFSALCSPHSYGFCSAVKFRGAYPSSASCCSRS